MQTFKPDCSIHVYIHAWGKPQKFSFGIWMGNRKGAELVTFSRVMAMKSRGITSLCAAKLALEQALRLKQEKIEIRVNTTFQFELLGKLHSVPREEELKLLYEDTQQLLTGFRFQRVLQVPQEQIPKAYAMALHLLRGAEKESQLRK